MKARWQQKTTPWRDTVRMVAIAFLLVAVADLALPQICAEDNEPLFPVQSAATSTFAHAGEPGEAQPHPTSSEDCFCCCSHIVSEDSASPLGELAIVSGSDQIAAPGIPLAPVQLLFHPPRLG